jgi:hypothetical protein
MEIYGKEFPDFTKKKEEEIWKVGDQMIKEAWFGLFILILIIILLWEMIKAIYKKIKRKLYIKKIAGKARRGEKADMEPWYPKDPPETPTAPDMYKQSYPNSNNPKQLSDYT